MRRLAVLLMGLCATPAAAAPLDPYIDRARVLVVSAPTSDDASLRRQDAAVGAARGGMKERELVVIRVIGSDARDETGARLDAAAIRGAVGLRAEAFGAALVGKDGGVKLRSDAAIATQHLFDTIDAMPMRRQEMRTRR